MTHEMVDEYVDLTDKHDIMNCYYLYYKRVEWAQAWTWPHDQDVRDVSAKARRRGRREELWLQDDTVDIGAPSYCTWREVSWFEGPSQNNQRDQTQ